MRSILAFLALAALLLTPPLASAATDACSLVKAGDLAPLLGGTPTSKPGPQGTTCTWTGTKPGHKLLMLTYAAMQGVPPEAAYMGARQQASADGDAKIADESGLGDRAFSGQVSFGVVFVVLQKGRLLQLQYWTGGQGTSQDVDALRPLVRKAVASF